VVDGQVLGGWRNTVTKGEAVVTVQPLAALDRSAREGLQAATERYGAFMQLPVRLVVDS
jgi:hypothetical protein